MRKPVPARNSSTPWVKMDERVQVTAIWIRGSDSRAPRTSIIRVAEVTLWMTASTRYSVCTVAHFGANALISPSTRWTGEEAVGAPCVCRVGRVGSVVTSDALYPGGGRACQSGAGAGRLDSRGARSDRTRRCPFPPPPRRSPARCPRLVRPAHLHRADLGRGADPRAEGRYPGQRRAAGPGRERHRRGDRLRDP